MRTTSPRRISVSLLGCLLAPWSKKYLRAKSTLWLGITLYNEVISTVEISFLAGKIEIAKSFERKIGFFDISWEQFKYR